VNTKEISKSWGEGERIFKILFFTHALCRRRGGGGGQRASSSNGDSSSSSSSESFDSSDLDDLDNSASDPEIQVKRTYRSQQGWESALIKCGSGSIIFF
jgi:hypothetical protein